MEMGGVLIELPFPPAVLSGHNTGHWRSKSCIIAEHREWAKRATLATGAHAEGDGDIRVSVTFYPPDRRGDRVNYPNRLKPYWDGIADALKVNDRRFLPSYHFAEPVKNGRVVVGIG
jgi:crossover junction endodeoxyribonuclease RusA